MSQFTALRQVDKTAHTITSSCSRLQHLGYQPTTEHVLLSQHYLRFQGQFDDGTEITGAIDLASWASRALPALDGIDWLSIDVQVLPSLFAAHPLELALAQQHAPFSNISTLGLVADSIDLSNLPALAASPGPVLVERITCHITKDVADLTTLNRLTIPITFYLGHSTLPNHALAQIQIGDVLLVERMDCRVAIHGKTLFRMEFSQESIMILEPHETEVADSPSHGPVTGLATLPVKLSIVLMEKLLPLAQVKNITPGEVIELPPSAMLEIEIRINQTQFARGELIQLPDGQLGVEIHQLWPLEPSHAIE